MDVRRIEQDDQAPMLLDGRIDIGYVRLPIDETGLRVAPLYTEPRVAVLPAGHPLAGKDQLTEADLAGEPLIWHGDPNTQPTRRPHPDSGYRVRGVDETLEHVVGGRGISFLPRSATVFYSHPDVAYVPVLDLAPTRCVSRWRHRTPRRWPRTSSPRFCRQRRSQRNAVITRCGSWEAKPPPSRTLSWSDHAVSPPVIVAGNGVRPGKAGDRRPDAVLA